MRNPFYFFLFYLAVQLSASAQVSFEKSSHHFGMILEENGSVSHDFVFQNTGNQAIRIKSVNTDCGCAASFWTQEEIGKMETGKIAVQFDPHNRPGSFEKSLKVTFSDGTISTLSIKGSVYFKTLDLKRQFPVEMGSIRASGKIISLGNIFNNQITNQVVAVYNQSESIVSWDTLATDLPKSIVVNYSKTSLNPKESGYVEFEFNPSISGHLGFYSQRVELFTIEQDRLKTFSITAIIFDSTAINQFDNENSPRIAVNMLSYDFGKVYRQVTIDNTITITNTGNRNLNINKIASNCNCLRGSTSKSVLLPGQQVYLTLTFDPSFRKGRQYSTITIFTNDPATPAQSLSVKAEI